VTSCTYGSEGGDRGLEQSRSGLLPYTSIRYVSPNTHSQAPGHRASARKVCLPDGTHEQKRRSQSTAESRRKTGRTTVNRAISKQSLNYTDPAFCMIQNTGPSVLGSFSSCFSLSSSLSRFCFLIFGLVGWTGFSRFPSFF
jgi:hypothetical protein